MKEIGHMYKKRLEKNMVFYTPGKSGSLFKMRSGDFVDSKLLTEAKEALEYESESKIKYVEDRRDYPRT